MLKKGEIEKKRHAQPKETLEACLKKTLTAAGYTKEYNTNMYQKFHNLFGDYYWNTSNKICVVPAFNAMELTDALLFEISQEFKFRAKEVKDHEEAKALVTTLSSEVNQAVKGN